MAGAIFGTATRLLGGTVAKQGAKAVVKEGAKDVAAEGAKRSLGEMAKTGMKRAAPSVVGGLAVNQMFDNKAQEREANMQGQIDDLAEGQAVDAPYALAANGMPMQAAMSGMPSAPMVGSMPQGQHGAVVSQPQQNPQQGGSSGSWLAEHKTGAMAAGMAGLGVAGAGAAMLKDGASSGHDREHQELPESSGSAKQTLGAGFAAGGAAGLKAFKEEDGGFFKKAWSGAKAGAIGFGAGALGKMSYDAIQEEGGGMKAGITGAGAAALTSKLQDEGPGFMKSGLAGFVGGMSTNAIHDKMSDMGHDKLADLVAGGGLGTTLGYSYGGDNSMMLGGAGGTALGGLDTLLKGDRDHEGADFPSLDAFTGKEDGDKGKDDEELSFG